MGCASSWPPNLTIFRVQYVLLRHPATLKNHCTTHTAFVRMEWDFSTSTFSCWVFTIPCYLLPELFVGLYLPILSFQPFIMLVVWMVQVHSIKSPFHIFPGPPIPILSIYGNIIIWFIYSPGFKIVKYFNITIVGVTYFSFGAGTVSVTSSHLNCSKFKRF